MKDNKEKNLYLYVIYTTLSSISLTRGIYLVYLQHKGLSIQDIALYAIVLNISTTLFEIPTGIIGDRFGRKNSLIIGCSLLAIQSFIMVNVESPIAFIVLAGVEGFAYTFISGCDGALLYDILKNNNLSNQYLNINSKLLALQSLIVGSSIFAGGKLATYSWKLIYYMQAFVMLLAIIFIINLKEDRQKGKNISYKLPYKKHILSKIFFVFLLGSSIVDGMFCGYYNMNQLFLHRINVSVSFIGLFFSASYFINSASYFFVGIMLKKLNRKQIFIYGLFIQSVFFFMLVNTKNSIVFLIITIIACFLPEILFAISDSIIQDKISSENRATILSIVSLLRTGTTAICYGIMGKVFNQVSLQIFFEGLAVITLFFGIISATIYLILKKHMRSSLNENK